MLAQDVGEVLLEKRGGMLDAADGVPPPPELPDLDKQGWEIERVRDTDPNDGIVIALPIALHKREHEGKKASADVHTRV